MADLIKRVAAAALSQIDSLLFEWFPNGTVKGGFFHIGNLHGDPGESLAIKISDGGFKDYSDAKVTGGDLVALYAKIHGLRQIEAATAMARRLGIDADGSPSGGKRAPEAAAAGPAPSAKQVAEDEWQSLNPAPADAPGFAGILTDRTRGDAAKHWVYRDATGLPILVIVRWETIKNGQPEKIVRPFSCRRHRDTGRMQWRAGSVDKPRPILNLDLMAMKPGAPVVVCEGEKASDAAAVLTGGAITTTSPNGATNAHHADWTALKGRDVLIWPDADETPAEYAAYLATEPPKPRDRDVSGTAYLEAVTKAARHVGAKRVEVIDRAKLAAALGMTELPRGFDAADVPVGTRLDLRVLLVERPRAVQADEDLFAGREAPAGGVIVRGDDRPDSDHQDLIDALELYLEEKGIVPDALDGWRRADSWILVNNNIASIANDFAFEYRHTDNDVSQARILETLEAMTRRWRDERRAALLATITGKPATDTGEAALKAWVTAVTGACSPLDLAVMKHWLWNCKRMALGMRTEHDLMPVVYGKQGSGKTTAVQMIVVPMAELALDMDATYLTDDRKAPVLAAAIIGRWEEMQGSQRADLEALKHTITSPTIGFRPMRTNQTVILPRTCSFIGTSNLPVDVMIQDTTGARRFVQLTTPERCDWDALQAIDATVLWQSVSETDAAPILDFLHLLREHQVDLVHRDPVSMWLESERWGELYWTRADTAAPYIVPRYEPAKGETFEQLSARFGSWCRTTGQASVGTKNFALRLRQEGFEPPKQERTSTGKRSRLYYVPAPLLPSPTATDGSPTTKPPHDPLLPGY